MKRDNYVADSPPTFVSTFLGRRLGNALRCPRCGCNNVHHGEVTVYAEKKVAIIGERDFQCEPYTKDDVRRNPSFSGCDPAITIDCRCEHCGDGLQLTISHHKGSTFVSWRDTRPSTIVQRKEQVLPTS